MDTWSGDGEADRVYSYTIFGLGVHSAIPLLAGEGEECGKDVEIRCGEVREIPPEAVGKQRWIETRECEVHLVWERVGSFYVRMGKEIDVHPAPGAEERLIRAFLLGACMSVLLQQRGDTVIHASAVSISGHGVAFVGEKGSGKSTLAAMMNKAGHRLVSDDTVVLKNGSGCLEMIPGFPGMKLWPDSVRTVLGYDPESLPRLFAGVEKRELDSGVNMASHPIPLERIFLIRGGPKPEISRLRPQIALVTLLPHWYGARFGDVLLESLGFQTHLSQCANVVRKVPVLYLNRQHSLETLPDILNLIEDEVLSSNTLERMDSAYSTAIG